MSGVSKPGDGEAGTARPEAAALERLSALADGELDPSATAAACLHWRESAHMRATWHAYHVIGDVLRSEDLAVAPSGDAAFLAALRVRLQQEPVVLAPVPAAARASRVRWSWRASSAVAAGFAVVAGATFVLLPGRSDDVPLASAVLSTSGPVAPAVMPVAARTAAEPVASTSGAEPQALIASGKLIRDARLDRYLAAHKQFAGSSALGVPSGYLRNATAIEGER